MSMIWSSTPLRRLAILLFVLPALAACSDGMPTGEGSNGGVSWIEMPTESDGSLRAAFARPDGPGPHPGAIFSHGTGVRVFGHEKAVAQGETDVRIFARALADAGFVAIAPLRRANSNSASVVRGQFTGSAELWEDTIDSGRRSVLDARRWLLTRPEVDAKRIVVVGFSEGGNATLWALGDESRIAAAVLMSPASIDHGPRRSLRAAAGSEAVLRIKTPILVTAGTDDNPAILGSLNRALIPALQGAGARVSAKLDYPGSHGSFYAIRQDYWNDIVAFLRRHASQ